MRDNTVIKISPIKSRGAASGCTGFFLKAIGVISRYMIYQRPDCPKTGGLVYQL